MKRLIAATFIALTVMAMGLGATATVRAQGAFDLMVFPAKVELGGTPGTSQEFEINVRNLGPQAETMTVYFNDYFIKANNDFVFQKPGHYSYSCSNWLSTDTPTMVVPSGQTVAKTFTLQVPPQAEPGGHYGVIFFEQAPPPGSPPVRARPRIGSLMLVTVPGQIIRQGDIKSVSMTSTWFWPARKLPFLPRRKVTARIVFYNSGNVHLTVKGSLSYKASFGWGSGKVEFSEITVLPKTTRYLQADIPDPPLVGSFKIKAGVQYGPSLDVFDTTKVAAGSFNMYPLSLMLLLLVLAAIVVALFMLRGWRKRRAAGEKEGDEPAGKKVEKEKKSEPAKDTDAGGGEESSARAAEPAGEKSESEDVDDNVDPDEASEPSQPVDDGGCDASAQEAGTAESEAKEEPGGEQANAGEQKKGAGEGASGDRSRRWFKGKQK
ncbi:MAG: hypothetical protein ACYC99_01540 [Candidatus Geothermincolia bacterium]